MAKYDFSGWATKSNIRCSDGRTIMSDAFKHMDGVEVPLVWNHQHKDLNNVLGKALLEHRDGEGVYAYCTLNDSDSGRAARAVLEHGDVTHMSIWANNLKEHMKSVTHGVIREVSLVLAGANPGAVIENVAIMHGDEMYEYDDEAKIYTDEGFVLHHSDDEDEDENEQKGEDEVAKQVDDDTKSKVDPVEDEIVKESEGEKAEDEVKEEKKEEEVEHSDEEQPDDIEHADKQDDTSDGKTIADVLETFDDDQRKVLDYIVTKALKDGKETDDDDKEVKHSEGGKDDMKFNAFEGQEERQDDVKVLSHSEMAEILDEAKRTNGKLSEVVLAHGIEDIDIMFPDAKTLTNEPEFIKRNDDWVAKVLGGVHHTPFSRIKTIFADITAAEARAKGYQKGNLKIEEVFKLLKRVTNPTTVYKKQKLDRDDVLDIKDFDILPWLKKEIRMMLNEEMARAFLIGDGRDPVDEADDKINEECIRPIWKMEDLFTVKVPVEVTAATTGSERAKAFITAVVKSRKHYKGSGNPAMFMPEDLLTECLLLEDVNGRVIYETEDKLRARLRVSEIIPVPVMEGDAIKRTDDDGNNFELAGLYVNLKDYNVGTDKGGEVNFFDDFDIDYNQMKYLMETRCSGTLIKPYAAVAVEFKTVAGGAQG